MAGHYYNGRELELIIPTSSLTMIDKETIGILYESSVAHMTFQAVKLTDIIKK